jgi:hypothetical protein
MIWASKGDRTGSGNSDNYTDTPDYNAIMNAGNLDDAFVERRFQWFQVDILSPAQYSLLRTPVLGRFSVAQVAELVDAQVSGTCGRKVVEVRVFSWAPFYSGR